MPGAAASEVIQLDLGTGLLAEGVVCSVFSVILSVPKISRLVPRAGGLPRILALASFVSVSGAIALLVWASLSSDFTYRYVWEHSSAGLDSIYKLSAVWAGGGGSLLLCTWLISIALVVEVMMRGSARGTGASFRTAFAAVMSLLVAFFSYTTLMSGVFDRTEAAALATYPEGLGLDTLLQTPEMILHAPLIFGAYSALCAVFAASVSYHLTGERLWHKVGLPWGRLAWILLTAGIGLGAVWAYYVIGWGGYWSWDPVETSSLVPWFLLTAFLHTQHRHIRKGEYPVASPMFGMSALVGVVFVSFVVRAGGLWLSSVHDYGASPESSAVSRLVSLLQEDPSVGGTLVFMLAMVVLATYLSVRAMRRAGPISSTVPPKRLSDYITDQNAMALAVILFTLAALAAVTLMVKNIESDQAATFAELDQKMSVLFVALAVTMSMCLVWRLVGRERALVLCIGLVVVSVALALAGTASGALEGIVAFTLPSFVVAIVASAVRLAQSLSKGTVRSRVFKAGAQVVHLGIALILVAYVVSANMQSYLGEGGVLGVPVGGEVEVGDYEIRLVGLSVSDDVSGWPDGVVEVRTAVVDIYEDGRLVEQGAHLDVLYGYSPSSGYYVLEKVPFVKSSALEDLYLSIEWISMEHAVHLYAKVVPMMMPLWTGLALLLAGAAMRLWSFELPAAASGRDA